MTTNTVVVCSWGGQLSGVPEVLTLARRLSGAWKTAVKWLVLGALPGDAAHIAGQYGVAAIDRADDPKLHPFQPDVYVEALAQYCAQQRPRALLFSQTDDTRLAAARLAGRLDCGVVMNVIDLEVGPEQQLRVTAPAYGGATHVVYELTAAPALLAVWTNAPASAPADWSARDPAVTGMPVDLGTIE